MKIKLSKINKYYYDQGKSTKALENISLEFQTDGSFVVITGESGAGKSSLIKVITGIEDYDEGEITFDDVPISDLTQKEKQKLYTDNISFVFQDYNLVESISGLENITLALLKQGKKLKEARKLAKKALLDVDLKDQIHMRVSKLSGGERQRVAIARSLALNTPVIVFDEPTGNLDNETSKTIIDLIEKISKGKLILYVTHDYEIVERCVTRHIVLSDGHLIKNDTISKIEAEKSEKIKSPSEEKFSFLSYLYSSYLIGFKRIGRLISTLIVLIFAYAGILGSFYGFANGIILANSTLSSFLGGSEYYNTYNMGNAVSNRKENLNDIDLSFDEEHYTDYANIFQDFFYLISPAYNNSFLDEQFTSDYIDSSNYNPDYMTSETVKILPYYDQDDELELISGTGQTTDYINLLIPDTIDKNGYYFENLEIISQDEFGVSIYNSYNYFTEEELEFDLQIRPKTTITSMYFYDSTQNNTNNIYLICNPNFLDEIKDYIYTSSASISPHAIEYQVDSAASKVEITTEDGEIVSDYNFLLSDSSSSSIKGIDKLFLSSDLEEVDFDVKYKNLIIPKSSFDIEYIDISGRSSVYTMYDFALSKVIAELQLESTTYFPTADIAKQQYDKYKDIYPRLYLQEKVSSNYVNYDLNILGSNAFARIGYLSLFVLILIAILIIAFLIKVIISRFYYRKDYDQQVLKYIGYSFKDIVIVNLIEFIGLSIVSIVITYSVFFNYVPNAMLIFQANAWMLILAIVISLLCAIFIALPRRKKVK